MKRKALKKAYNINQKFFGKIPLKLKEIKLYKCESREEFNNIFKKYHKKKPEGKHIVAFVSNKPSFWQSILGRKRGRWKIFIVSEDVFEKEGVFDREYYFNVLIHEVAHIFLRYQQEMFHRAMEYICYFIANQRKFHKKEYLLGKKLFMILKKRK